jgi:amino acid adenylation domain-containing protein
MGRSDPGPYLPCSRAQEAIWFAEQASDLGGANNLPLAIEFSGPLDVEILSEALASVARAQPLLRTRFAAVDGRLVRAETEAASVERPRLAVHDVEGDVDSVVAEESRSPVDLLSSPYRLLLLRCGPERHLLLAVFHHCAFDGRSKDLFVRDLSTSYSSLVGGGSGELAARGDYSAFVALEREDIERLGDDASRYWKPTLAEAGEALRFPPCVHLTDGARPTDGAIRFAVDQGLLDALRAVARTHQVSSFVVLVAAVKLLQHLYAGGADGPVATAVPMGTRPSTMADTIGMFVNEAPLVARVAGALPFTELIHDVDRRARDLFRLRRFPFNEAVRRFGPSADPRALIPQVSVSYWDTPGEDFDIDGLRVAADRQLPIYGCRWEARFRFLDHPGKLTAVFEYDTTVLDRSAAARMVDHLQRVLASVARDPDRQLRRTSLLSPAARASLTRWNDTHVPYPAATLHQLVEEQVKRTPSAPALASSGQQWTYGQLDARANQLGHELRRLGVKPDDPVGVCAERSLDLVVALLGTLKAGGAYLPLDPEYPPERLALILTDARPRVTLVQADLLERLPAIPDAKTVVLDADWETIARQPETTPPPAADPGHLAYILYTSGSTGKPKGVMIEHRAIVNRILWMQDAFGLGREETVLQKTPFSFDVSVWEFFWPLVAGARLALARPGGHRDSAYIRQVILDEDVTTLHFVPSMLRLFLEEPGIEQCTGLRRVICSGEALTLDLQERFFARLSAQLHNLYGPTEAAVDVTHWACRRDSDLAVVPIGRPIANTQMYVLGHALEPAGIGVAGELHVGGVQLARGYVNRPDLTNERFIPDPFTQKAGGRLYRTGDLGRLLPDGSIEFLGRLDHQVKIRGNRVELGEIEATLLAEDDVRQAVVTVWGEASGNARLVAYVVPALDAILSGTDLRRRLAEVLPDYMLPSAFVSLREVPLTPSGKLDRKQLPAPDASAGFEEGYVAPRTAIEQQLADIWSAVLERARVGIHDNFFEMGGHSLTAAAVVAKVRSELGHDVPLGLIFAAPTVAEMAASMSESRFTAMQAPIPRAPRRVLAQD